MVFWNVVASIDCNSGVPSLRLQIPHQMYCLQMLEYISGLYLEKTLFLW